LYITLSFDRLIVFYCGIASG